MSKSSKRWYLIAYDIKNHKRLIKTNKLLRGYGSSIQYSIFKCKLTKCDIEKLIWQMKKIIKEEDNILILYLCSECADKIKNFSFNSKYNWTNEINSYKII